MYSLFVGISLLTERGGNTVIMPVDANAVDVAHEQNIHTINKHFSFKMFPFFFVCVKQKNKTLNLSN